MQIDLNHIIHVRNRRMHCREPRQPSPGDATLDSACCSSRRVRVRRLMHDEPQDWCMP